jgi:putative glutamine amidotransferase
MAPRIGIAPGLDAGGRIRAGRRYHYLDAAYARAVADAGGLPLYLAAPGDPRALCDAADGLLIPGGDDFPPAAPYPPQVRFTPVAPEQLAFDRALLRAALERGLPVLAICYGMQLLCLASGGRLLHHVPIDAPDAGPHALPEPDGRHALRVTPGTRLAEILGADPPPVNSLHHQAVAAPGRGLRVAARAPDGLIEAVEWADAAEPRFVIGVQWHPEKLDGPHRERLFGAFVAACASAPARP